MLKVQIKPLMNRKVCTPKKTGRSQTVFAKRKCFDHDAAVREPEETGRRSRFCVAKILTMPICEANFLTKKACRVWDRIPRS